MLNLAALVATTVTIVQPFAGGAPAPGLHVAATHTGSCVGGSDAADRFDAWRCGFGNFIIDPCFSDPSHRAGYLLCLPKPWSASAIRLQVRGSRGPNTSHHAPSGRPWGLQLQRGTHCLFVQGASSEVQGLRLNYVCGNGSALYGNPRRGTPWTILERPGTDTPVNLTRVPIARAWY